MGGCESPLEQRLTSVSELIRLDERTAQLWQEWSECVAHEGIYAPSLDDLIGDLTQEATELRREARDSESELDAALGG